MKLALEGEKAVSQAAKEMHAAILKIAPQAQIDGFTVQPMILSTAGTGTHSGRRGRSTFGSCLLFGHGGVATEVIADRVMGLPPLNDNLAQDMIARTRVAKLLAGYRDRPPANLPAVAAALVALSDLVIEFPEIVELDINPLLADVDGVMALDARIIVQPTVAGAMTRLSIRPYPGELSAVSKWEIRLCRSAPFARTMQPLLQT